MKNKYLDLFLTFLKLGAITFGGGYAMIANLKEEIVDKKQWLTDEELLEMTAISESTPGPVAINMATFVGYRRGKTLGSILATLGCILPSIIIIFILSFFFNRFIDNKYVAYAFVGIKCAVAVLIGKAALKLFKNIKSNWWQIVLFVVITLLVITFDILGINFSSIYLILMGLVLGIIINVIIDTRKAKTIKDESLNENQEVVEEEDNNQDKEGDIQ